MAKSSPTDFLSTIRWKSVSDRAQKALSDLQSGGRGAGSRAETAGRQAVKHLRAAADELEKRFDIGGAGTRSKAAKKAAATRKRTSAKKTTAKKRTTAKKTGAKKTARKAAKKR